VSKGIYRPNKCWLDPDTLPAPTASTSEPTKEGTRGNPVMGSSPAPQKSRFTQSPLTLPAPEPTRQSTPVSSDREDQSEMTDDQKRLARFGKKKAAASPRAPADIPTKEQKAPKQPVKGQESPEAKASHPMITRQRASGTGGLRSGGGSGSTDTCVAQGNPSKT
jgi:hypothetical protein